MLKRRYNLALRIALPFALLLTLIVGGLGLYLSSFIRSTYLDVLRSNLQSETNLIADRMSGVILSNPAEAVIEEQAKQFSSVLGARVTIIDPTGKVLGDSSTNPLEMENHLNRPEVQRALKKVSSTETRYSQTLRMDLLYAAAPIQNGDQIIGIARMALPLQTIQQNEKSMFRSVMIATLIAGVLAILLAGWIAAYTVRPIRELTETAQGIADGQTMEIMPSSRQDEVGQLHQSIQLMAQRLKEQIDTLRAERGKLEAVLTNMTDGVIIVDAEGIVQLINPAATRLFQMEQKEALHRSIVEVVRHHMLVEIWRKAHITGVQQTATLETTPGRLFLHGIATPLEGSMPGMTLLVFQDLTHVRKLETVRRDFVSNISHELRTPLASLKALAETLQEGALEDPPAARRFLERMDIEIDSLTQMVRELLELSRIESNRVPLQRAAVSPCQVAAPAVERMQLQAERAGLMLSMDCPEQLPQVWADAERVGQVLVNIIHNAIKFTSPGGNITVSAWQEGGFVTFAIRDSGAGISPDILPRIFERFYKADRSRSGGGTGLGLSIARHLIEAHGGRIWAESTEKIGSTFFFTLPTA